MRIVPLILVNRFIHFYLLFLLFIVLIPLLILSFYSFPTADDFCVSAIARPLDTLSTVKYYYMNWSGRYSAMLLLAINPLVFDLISLYKYIPFLTLIGLTFSTYLFHKSLFIKSVFFPFLLTSLTIFLFFYQIPTLSEGLYWVTSAAVYFYAIITFNILIYFFSIYSRSGRLIVLFPLIILVIVSVGFNESATFSYVLVWLILSLILFKIHCPHYLRAVVLVILIISIAFGLISILAPGNFVRLGTSEPKNLLDIFLAIKSSIYSSLRHIIRWLPMVIIVSLFFVSVVSRDIVQNKLSSKLYVIYKQFSPLYSLILSFSLVVLGFLPAYLSVGVGGPSRNVNFIYFSFLISFFLFIIHCLVYFNNFSWHNFYKNIILKFALAFFIVLSIFNEGVLKQAYKDIFDGSAKSFSDVNQIRLSLVKNGGDFLCLPTIENPPFSIFSPDLSIQSDSNDWRNYCFAQYFNKKSVYVP